MTDVSVGSPAPSNGGSGIGYKRKVTDGMRHDRVLHDKRNRTGRWAVFVLATLLIIFLPVAIFTWVGQFFFGLPQWGAAVGLVIGGSIYSYILPEYMLITVQLLRGFVTQNIFSGDRIPYGPGWHPTYLWESREKKGNAPLDLITISISEEVPTKSGQALVKTSLQYMPNLRFITNFVGIDETTIRDGFAALIRSFLSSRLAGFTLEEARNNIGNLNDELESSFMTLAVDVKDSNVSAQEFEETYGIMTVILTIEGIDYPPAVQKTRDAKDEAEQQLGVVAQLYGMTVNALQKKIDSKEIPLADYNAMLDRAMAMSENATMSVKSYHGLGNTRVLVGDNV
ncbi:MAG TPA: hypothetical protein VGA06_02150 [Candidatus Paceibacterota bacterium]